MPKSTLPLKILCDRFIPICVLLKPIEDHDVETEAYSKCRKLFEECPDLSGVYVTTEASIPVLNAARDAKVAGSPDDHHDRFVSRSCSADSVRRCGGDDLPASARSGPDGVPHVARVSGRGCEPIASGRTGAALGDARKSGFLSDSGNLKKRTQEKKSISSGRSAGDMAEDFA